MDAGSLDDLQKFVRAKNFATMQKFPFAKVRTPKK